MKKALLITCVSLICLGAHSQSFEHKVEVVHTQDGNKGARSVVFSPKVFLISSMQQIAVSYYSPMEDYNISIVDQKGVVVLQAQLICDGALHNYPFGILTEGNYSVVIESKEQTFEGEFFVE